MNGENSSIFFSLLFEFLNGQKLWKNTINSITRSLNLKANLKISCSHKIRHFQTKLSKFFMETLPQTQISSSTNQKILLYDTPMFKEWALLRKQQLKAETKTQSDRLQSLKISLDDLPSNRSFLALYEEVLSLTKEKNAQKEKRLMNLLYKFDHLPKLSTPYPQQIDLESIKQIPIESLYAFEKVKTISNRVSALCPFHAEDSPSFTIYLDDNHFHCFGCNAHGDNISFTRLLYPTFSFQEACAFIARGG